MSGRLVLVSTPIGNLGDLTPRASQELREADIWLVEDTRVSGKLASVVGVKKPMLVLNEHTGDSTVEAYAREVESGNRICLLTDGGTPGISDPGAKLVDRLNEAGVEVDIAPGPSAVTAALALSGFFAQRFAFLGFLPRKPGDIARELEPFSGSPLTLVLFESPFRADKLLGFAYESLGPRRYAICREMTKAHQQVFRDRLPSIPSERQVPRKGEFTIVVEGMRRGSVQSD